MNRFIGLLLCLALPLAVWAQQSPSAAAAAPAAGAPAAANQPAAGSDASAQTPAANPPQVAPLPDSAPNVLLHAARGFTTGFSVEGYTFLLMPTAGAFLSVPFSIAHSNVELTPGVGFDFLFNAMTDVPASYYLPVGLSVDFRSRGIALSARYYFALPDALSSGIAAATLRGYTPVWSGARDEIDLAIDFGLSVPWYQGAAPYVLLTLGPTLAYRHTW